MYGECKPPRRVDNVDTVIFLPRFTWLPPSYVLVVAIHPLDGSRANWQSKPNPWWGRTSTLKIGILQATSNSLELLFCYPCGVRIVPLTISYLEHCTISLRASTESQATRPSRRWQPPRLTSTIDLQHEHLVPLDAISQCSRTRIALSLDWMNTIKHK